MNEEIVYIENMNSPRDILLVSQALELLGLRVKEVELGAASYYNPGGVIKKATIDKALEEMGFSLMDSEAKLFSEQVRSLVSVYIDNCLRQQQETSFETFLEDALKTPYLLICQRYLSITGQRLSIFLRRMKVERAKILLINSNFSQEEIALKLGFKTVKGLSRMFREVTGQSMSVYTGRELYAALPKVV
ncbi:helix-turn-helix domain-containing protein [Cesiribacter andamanensis]|uniref:DNA gyrase inhibitor n=1 Tax=Cesiribacter andamanensis AMV16 TaxID=1279009 RepID=M7N492_9BACT|nr:helix-turn-helix domain-containing protein [Cesiribacter andamanensis]EMR03493.1 DNA gyrase inhibitor [Cesiribacter andamanensis AMV16]